MEASARGERAEANGLNSRGDGELLQITSNHLDDDGTLTLRQNTLLFNQRDKTCFDFQTKGYQHVTRVDQSTERLPKFSIYFKSFSFAGL